jgi:hypothetical protein
MICHTSFCPSRLILLPWSELSPSLQEQLLKRILTISPSRFSRTQAKISFGDSLVLFLAEINWKSLSPSLQKLFFQIAESWIEKSILRPVIF